MRAFVYGMSLGFVVGGLLFFVPGLIAGEDLSIGYGFGAMVCGGLLVLGHHIDRRA